MKSLLVYWMLCAGHVECFLEKGPVSWDSLQAALEVLAKGHDAPDTALGKRAAEVADDEGEGEGGSEGKKPRLRVDDSDTDSAAEQVLSSATLGSGAALSEQELLEIATAGLEEDAE